MRGVVRVTKDKAGGTILGGGNFTVFCNNVLVTVLNDKVMAHGKKPHTPPPSMVQASSTVFANNKPVCRLADKASCGHPASASSDTFAG